MVEELERKRKVGGGELNSFDIFLLGVQNLRMSYDQLVLAVNACLSPNFVEATSLRLMKIARMLNFTGEVLLGVSFLACYLCVPQFCINLLPYDLVY